MSSTSSVRAPEIKWAQDNYSVHCKFMVAGARDCNVQVLDQRRLVFTCTSSRQPDVSFRAAFTLDNDVESTNYAPRVEEKYVRVILHKKKFKQEWGRLGDAKASGLTLTYDWDLDRALEAQNDQMGLNDDEDDEEGADDREEPDRKPAAPKPAAQPAVSSAKASTGDQPDSSNGGKSAPSIEKVTVEDRRPKKPRAEQAVATTKKTSMDVWLFVLVGVLSLAAGIAIGRISTL
jgi:hypothetical protein